jgi:hypothetical protein
MPPLPMQLPLLSSSQIPRPIFDASIRHPVFFTDRLQRAPAGVNTGGGAWASPVAVGYVFNDGAQRRVDGVKL